jgi:hypothetical protein
LPKGFADIGLVGMLDKPKFMKLFARPLSCATDEFQISSWLGDPVEQSPQARFEPWQHRLSM